MRPWQKAHFGGDFAYGLGVAAVDALAILDDMLAHQFIFQIADKALDLLSAPSKSAASAARTSP